MKSYVYFCLLSISLIILLIAGANLVLIHDFNKNDKQYYTEMNRIRLRVQSGTVLADIKPDKAYIRSFEYIPLDKVSQNRLENTEFISYWTLYGNNGALTGFLKFERIAVDTSKIKIFYLNCILFLILAISAIILLYIGIRIIKPFTSIQELPVQLAKGNLETELKEFPGRYFGKFVWGLNMLKNALNDSRQKTVSLEKDRHTMLSSISHGIKTPVSNIRLYASAIAEGMYCGDKLISATRSIDDNAQKINELVNELISSASSSFTDINIEPEDFYIKDWLEQIRKYHSEGLALKHIKFEVTTNTNPIINSDPNVLSVIANNLIDNAVKYGDGDYIQIFCDTDDDAVMIHVINSGTPPTSHELPHIFTSFWRGSNADGSPGSGLGLFICKKLARKLGGDIYATARENEMELIIVLDICLR